MSTLVCPSAAVVNVSFFRVGIVVFRGMSSVRTLPKVSRPRVNGVTSSRTMSPTSPERTPACIAAPKATASSGLTLRLGSLPNTPLTFSRTAGIRLIPPTTITSSISLAVKPASFNACLQGPSVRSMRPATNCSNRERLRVLTK